jgi:hypothetical protein
MWLVKTMITMNLKLRSNTSHPIKKASFDTRFFYALKTNTDGINKKTNFN